MTHHQFQIGSSGSRTRNNEQTTGLSHPRVWTAVILLCLLYSNGVPALAQDPADRATITESGPTARVDARLGDLERECNRVEADMDGSALRGSEPPQFFRNRMGLLRVNLRLAIEQLAGQPRQEVQPLLDRYEHLLYRLDNMKVPRKRPLGQNVPLSAVRSIQASSAATGSIAGVITDERTELPLSGVTVQASLSNPLYSPAASTQSDAEGKYQLTGLAAGEWRLAAMPGTPYTYEIYTGAYCSSSYECTGAGTNVSVAADAITSGINFALVKFGTISGTITDQQTSAPIANVDLRAYRGSSSYKRASSDSAGRYSLGASRLLPGTYKLVADHPLYIDELHSDIPFENGSDLSVGTDIVVESGSQVTIDFQLLVAGSISGVVTEATTGNPIGGCHVYCLDQQGHAVAYDYTDQNGAYSIGGLPEGNYYVRTDTSGPYQDQVHPGIACANDCDLTSASTVHAAPGVPTEGVDFGLFRLGGVEGRVVDATSLSALPGCTIHLFTETDQYATSSFHTNADGEYRVGNVLPGDYYVQASSPTHLDMVYQNVPAENISQPAGTPVPVSLEATTPDINFALSLGGAIRGTVRAAADQAPLSSFEVAAYDEEAQLAGSTSTDPLGGYFIRDLPTGDYRIAVTYDRWYPDNDYLFSMSGGIDCAGKCDNGDCTGACDIALATPVSVNQGQITEPVEFSLKRLGHISGTVTSTKAETPAGALYLEVMNSEGQRVTSSNTNNDGSYEIKGLLPGTYWVEAYASSFNRGLHTGALCLDECERRPEDGLIVEAGATVSGINFQVHPYAKVSGRVTDSVSGTGISNVKVVVDESGYYYQRWVYSDDAGYFTFSLPARDYAFSTAGPGTPYSGEVYPERSCVSCRPREGERVEVRTEDLSGINLTLDKTGRIAGRVTDAESGAGMFYAWVSVYDSQGVYLGKGPTGSTGDFTIQAPKGIHYLVASGSSYIAEIYDNLPVHTSRPVTDGTPITVVPTQTNYGKDFALARLTFADVSYSYWARPWIDAVFQAGITAGCAGNVRSFCPESVVERQQMAVFLLKAMEGAAYQPPAAAGLFADVDSSSPFAPWIEEVWRRGLTAGCGQNLFCPTAPVTREQAAVLLLKAIETPGYLPPPASGQFDDVPAGNPFAPWVEELARRGITAGCSAAPPGFCPAAELTRAQMAVLLARTFALPVGGF
ncbi:MAG: hypothetical protein EHM23_03335 [Acidobacteria bacterium]|nr:MAG: hypothetical protein EHM23_03335 [Acidobacteriota bacterium]